jgi:hypothetical protein
MVTMKRIALYVFCAALVMFAGQAAAQGAGKMGGMAGMARDELGSSAVFDAKDTLWAVHKQGPHVVLRRSDDFGRSWSPPVQVNALPEPVGADGDSRPKIALGAQGEIYVTWTQPLSKPFTGFIRFARSLDGGKTFSLPLTVHADRQEITHRFDAIAVNQGKLFVAWIDKRDGEASRAKNLPYRGAAVYYAVSDDGGANFRGDYKIADYVCECCRLALVPRADGTVTMFWRHVFEPNLRDHALVTLHPDGKVDGFRRATFDNWAIDACPHHGPSLVADAAGTLHAVWFDLGPENAGALYGRLVPGKVEGLRRIGGKGAEHPDLAIAGERLAIVWKEFDGEKSQLRGMVSADNGNTWRDVALGATQGPSGQPFVLATQGKFFVFWNTRDQPLKVVPLS